MNLLKFIILKYDKIVISIINLTHFELINQFKKMIEIFEKRKLHNLSYSIHKN